MTQQPNLIGQLTWSILTFSSWNCEVLNQPVKRSRVLHLQHLGTQIAFFFLQETHLRVSDHFRLRKGWVGQFYHSTFQNKLRGAAILIHKLVPFVSSNVISDSNGRYIVVPGRIYNTPLILANVYVPNWDATFFFLAFLSSLTLFNLGRPF